MGSALGATAVIAELPKGTPCFGSVTEGFINGCKNLIDDEASQGWREGVTLRKAVFLGERIKGAVRAVEKTKIGVLVHQVKIMYQRVKARVGFDNVQCFFPRHLIPTVDKVNKDTSPGWGEVICEGLGDEGVKLAIGSVN
jgi:hypothetical protein